MRSPKCSVREAVATKFTGTFEPAEIIFDGGVLAGRLNGASSPRLQRRSRPDWCLTWRPCCTRLAWSVNAYQRAPTTPSNAKRNGSPPSELSTPTSNAQHPNRREQMENAVGSVSRYGGLISRCAWRRQLSREAGRSVRSADVSRWQRPMGMTILVARANQCTRIASRQLCASINPQPLKCNRGTAGQRDLRSVGARSCGCSGGERTSHCGRCE